MLGVCCNSAIRYLWQKRCSRSLELKELDAFNVVKGGNLIHIIAFNPVSFSSHKAFPITCISGNVRSVLICETMGMSDATKIVRVCHINCLY